MSAMQTECGWWWREEEVVEEEAMEMRLGDLDLPC